MQNDGMVERGLRQLGKTRGLQPVQVRELVALSQRLLAFTQRHVTAGAVLLGHVASCTMLACEAELHIPPGHTLLRDMQVSSEYTQWFFCSAEISLRSPRK